MSQIERYEQGMAFLMTPPKSDKCWVLNGYRCPACREFHTDRFTGSVALPHSCDEWIIGGKEEVEALIHDLQQLLENLK